MESGNETQPSEFLLLGFTEDPALQPIIFGLLLYMYLVTVSGNLLIILAILSEPHLHTPMYFFLANLSSDICFTSTTIPKMLVNIQTHSRAISYAGCITQMFFFLLFGSLDNFLLTMMAYDRFAAISHLLYYMVIMNPCLCVQLILISWVITALNSFVHSLLMPQLNVCTDLQTPHFVCGLDPVIHSACSDTFLNNVIIYVTAVLFGGVSMSGILYAYSRIISSIRAISSAQGKYKTFSTCVSHLSIVSLLYGTLLGVYITSPLTHNSYSTATTSVMYTVVTPMLNSFIYSLRNRDIKRALGRSLGGHHETVALE